MIELLRLLSNGQKKRYVLFLDDKSSWLSMHVHGKEEELKQMFRSEDYVFLPVSEIESSLDQEMMRYMFPWRVASVARGGIEDVLRKKYRVGDRTGLLCVTGAKSKFYPIEEDKDHCFNNAAEELMFDLHVASATEPEEAKPKRKTETAAPRAAYSIDLSKEEAVRFSRVSDDGREDMFEIPLEEDTESVIAAWKQFSKQYGITYRDLARLLDEDIRYSKLVIKPSGHMFLSDYDNMEVKMDDLTKALYFFYLRHPEGVAQKDLFDYEDEILDIYLKITPRDDMDEIKLSVFNFLLDYDRINTSMSRIKKAFKDLIDDRIAKAYYVDGKAGKPRSVKLDRDFVIWER